MYKGTNAFWLIMAALVSMVSAIRKEILATVLEVAGAMSMNSNFPIWTWPARKGALALASTQTLSKSISSSGSSL